MGRQFEAGRQYRPYADEFEPITVTRRTAKTIWCAMETGGFEWMMRVKVDENGNEYAVDRTVPAKWRDAFTYKA